MSDETPPPERRGSPVHMIVGLLAVIVVLLAVLIGVLLQRRAEKHEQARAGESTAPTPTVAKTAEAETTAVKTTETKTTETKTTETKPARDPVAEAKELNRRLELDTLQTEATNQLLDARSKLGRALKLVHERPGRALGELLLIERLLDALPELASEYTTHNTEAENLKLLAGLKPQVDQIRVAVLATRGMGLRLRGKAQDLKAARKALESGLAMAQASPKAQTMLEVELALVLAASGEAAAAVKSLQAVLKADPSHAQALVALADLQEKAGKVAEAMKLLERAVTATSGKLGLPLRRLAKLQLEANRFEPALRTYEQLQTLDEMDVAATIGRGRALLGSGEPAEAKGVFTDAIDKDPRLPDGYHYRGLAHLAQRKLKQAVKDFEVALSRDATFGLADLGLGRALELLGEEERARQQLLKAARDPLVAAEAHARLARHFLWRADPNLCAAIGTPELERQALRRGAAAAAAKAKGHPLATWAIRRLSGKPAVVEAYRAEATFLLAEGRRYVALARRSSKRQYLGSAQRALSLAWVLDPRRAETYLVFAELEADWNELEPALAAASKAITIDPTLAEAHLLVGELLGSRLPPAQRKPEVALTALQKARDQAKNVGTRLRAHLAIARTHRATAKAPASLTQARDALAQAAALIPEDPTKLGDEIGAARDVVVEWQQVCEALKDAPGAKQAAAAAARLQRVSQAQVDKLLVQARKKRDRLDYSGALKLFDQVIALDPKCAEALYERGTCYLKIGNFIPGILDFSRSLELNPRISDQVFNKVYQIWYVVDLNRVITELNKIVADHPKTSYVIFLRGFFYVAAVAFEKMPKTKAKPVVDAVRNGIADFDRTLELNPEHVTALNYRGFLKARLAAETADAKKRGERFNEALADLRRAKRLDPPTQVNGYLQAYLLMRRAEGQAGATAAGMREEAVLRLKEAFKAGFRGKERLKNERAFAPILNHPEVAPLLRGR